MVRPFRSVVSEHAPWCHTASSFAPRSFCASASVWRTSTRSENASELRLSSLSPCSRSSTTTTSRIPRRFSPRSRLLPMKPAPPVTMCMLAVGRLAVSVVEPQILFGRRQDHVFHLAVQRRRNFFWRSAREALGLEHARQVQTVLPRLRERLAPAREHRHAHAAQEDRRRALAVGGPAEERRDDRAAARAL